jgi:RNA polymerase sigma factor (sigma-70 family)
MQTEDGSLISKCLNGEPEAFGILVDKYKSGIYAFVYTKLNDFRDAQDVTQDVFVEAFCKLHSLKRWESFAFWLYRIASNLCKRWIRTKIRHPEPEFIEDQNPLEIDSTAISSYRDDQMNQLIREAMDSLPEIYRETLLLYYFGGMNSNEIARALGVSPTAILQRLTRARAQLKEDIIGMIGITFNEKKLGSGFTFHIVEAVKRLKINPVSTTKGLPWGLSLATGLMIAVLGFNPDVTRVNLFGNTTGLPLSVESKVLKIGEIPVDVVKTSENTIISNKLGKADNGEPKKPDIQNVFMSPQGEGEWSKKADMPMAKCGVAACTIGNKIYVIGGLSVNGGIYTSVATVEEYDPKNDSWTKKADMPTPRDLFGFSVVNGKIYAIGGEKMVGQNLDWLQSAVEEYDPRIDKWTKKANMLTARFGASAVAVNGKIYVIGGGNSAAQAVPNVEEYDPKIDKWTKKTDMPTAKAGSAFAEINGKIYIFGGETGGWCNGPVLSTVEEYDPVTDTWVEKSNMPSPLLCSSACIINNKVYIFGGENPNKEMVPLSTVYKYDPVNDKWTTKPDMPVSKTILSTSSVNGKIYVIGGASLTNGGGAVPLSSVEEYTPEDWSVSPQGKLPNTWGKIKAK